MKHAYGRKCLFINGPSGSGKTEMESILRKRFGSISYKMSGPLEDAIQGLLAINPDVWRKILASQEMKAAKFHLSTYTYRELLVKLFEEWVVPTFGKDYLGQLGASLLSVAVQATPLYTIDVGNDCELLPMVKVFGIENCGLVNIEREGCTFNNDCRSYINGSDLGITSIVVVNQFEMELYEQQCINVVRKLWPSLVVE